MDAEVVYSIVVRRKAVVLKQASEGSTSARLVKINYDK